MIIRIFNSEDMKLYKFPNKLNFVKFVEQETGYYIDKTLSIERIFRYLPQNIYTFIRRDGSFI